jgi:[acyl-carrier-protein] S-malonyltransferase
MPGKTLPLFSGHPFSPRPKPAKAAFIRDICRGATRGATVKAGVLRGFSLPSLDTSGGSVAFQPTFYRDSIVTTAFVFPGQGSQAVGMGKGLSDNFEAARKVFAEVDDALGEKLTTIMWEGPADQLTLTENTQPALVATAVATVRVLEAEAGLDVARDIAFVAGHSLGEYAAHAVAGSLSLADAVKLVKTRGRAMQQAVPVGVGAMAALMGLEPDAVRAVAADAAQGEVCDVANDNAPGQIVVSGHKAAVERAVEIAKGKGSRAMMLQVSAPFHCKLMQPAADVMAKALSEAKVGAPKIPVVANFTAQPVTDPQEIVKLLVAQVTGTVRWRESIGYLAANGVTNVVEAGTGKVLSGLMKRINKEVAAQNIGTAEDVAAYKAKA